ncbi:MAG TPA: GcrA family cell cycle regulator [Sphingobium sp.]
MAWTTERIDQLKTMWERGMTASQIAEELGGVSRNAVIGKAHRLGLQARPSPVKAADSSVKAAAAPRKAVAEATPVTAPTSAPVVMTEVPSKPSAPTPPPFSTAPTPVAPTAPAAPAPAVAIPAVDGVDAPPPPPQPRIISVGPGGFLRQGPGEQQQPIPPAPPRRLVPAKPSAEIAGKTSLLDLTEKICKWPIGHPGEPDFHFCGVKVNPGFPYCVEHCGRAYQAQLPRGTRRPPPPLPFGGPRVR